MTQLEIADVEVHREVDGTEMGVLTDGTQYAATQGR